jgi:hypothetical protein
MKNDSNRAKGTLVVRTQLRAGFSSEEGFPHKASLITEVGFPALDAGSKDASK